MSVLPCGLQVGQQREHVAQVAAAGLRPQAVANLLVEGNQPHRVLLMDHQVASAAARQMPYSNFVSSWR